MLKNQYICNYCRKEIKGKRGDHKYKYCSISCYANARFGETIADEISGIRNPRCLEAVKLCQAGMTQSEAVMRTGIEPHILATWFHKYGEENKKALYGGRVCGHCGKSLLEFERVSNRRYCSESCAGKASYARKNPKSKRMEFDVELREKGMELYWGGLDGTAIARHLGVAEGTVHSWIHYFGHMRKRRRVPEVLALLPVTERLMAATSASEWRQILRQAAPKGDKSPVRIFCGEVTGHSESNQLAAIVSEVLKRDPCDGTTYAFCSREKELISTICWNNGAFCYTKQPKAVGRYIWPNAEVGMQIDIRKNEFEYLMSLSKKRGQKPSFT